MLIEMVCFARLFSSAIYTNVDIARHISYAGLLFFSSFPLHRISLQLDMHWNFQQLKIIIIKRYIDIVVNWVLCVCVCVCGS